MPDPDAEVKEGEEPPTKTVPKTENVWETVNIAKPLWMRSPKEVTDEEYAEFYQTTFKAYDSPAAHVHFSLEGQVRQQTPGRGRGRGRGGGAGEREPSPSTAPKGERAPQGEREPMGT